LQQLADLCLFSNGRPADSYGDALRNATVNSHRGKTFLPDSQLNALVTDDVITFELSKPKSSMKLLRFGKRPVIPEDCASYRRILAILYLMKRPSLITVFIKHKVRDTDLPLDKVLSPKAFRNVYELRSRHNRQAHYIHFKKHADAHEFWRKQWSVLVQTFADCNGSNVPHDDFTDLEPETILPFLSKDPIGMGGSGQVYKVRIHPEYHSLPRTNVRPRILSLDKAWYADKLAHRRAHVMSTQSRN
jgi:hypothetical protein